MSKLKLVKDLRKEQVGLLETLGAYLLQEKQNIDFYDDKKEYHKGDTIIEFDTNTKRYVLKRCLRTTTGIFDANSWVIEKIQDSNNIASVETVYDDMLTMMDILHGMVGSHVKFNHVYINDFSDTSTIQINSGILETGRAII